jgi:hypothetical protein
MAEAQGSVPASEKPSDDALPMIPAAGGPLKLSGLALISLLTGLLALIAAIVLAAGLLATWSDTVVFGAIIAGLVLTIAAVVCGGMALDRVRDTPLLRRDRVIIMAGPVMPAVGLVIVVFVWGVLTALINQPEAEKPFAYPLVVTVDVPAVAAILPPAPPVVPAPAPVPVPDTVPVIEQPKVGGDPAATPTGDPAATPAVDPAAAPVVDPAAAPVVDPGAATTAS